MCKAKSEGGLGIKGVTYFNRVLIAKWMWKLKVEKYGFWRQMVLSKYEDNENVRRKPTSKAKSWWWKDLCHLYEEGHLSSWFYRQLTWKLGTTNDILLWEDKWMGIQPLKEVYPRLYLISNDEGKLMQQVGSWSETGWSWNLEWRRSTF